MISVIIPTYNEAGHVGTTLGRLQQAHGFIEEVIVVDGGSTDGTVQEATEHGALVIRSGKGRALQMNAGAAIARGDVVYFLHAETDPPEEFHTHIEKAIEAGNVAGCFRLSFDLDHWFLRLNCWFTRFDLPAFRYGDQSLFVTKEVFDRIGGFNEEMLLLEDNDVVRRLKKEGPFSVLPFTVITSARKYVENGVYRMQFVFYWIYILYILGCSQERLLGAYRKMIRQDKI